MKKGVTIMIVVLVFAVIAVVVYLFVSSNKQGVVTKTTESTGISNLFGSINPQIVSSLLQSATMGGLG